MTQTTSKSARPSAKKASASKSRTSGSPSATKAKVVTKKPTPTKPNATAVKPATSDKPRQKLIRDSFTMPKSDFELIATLKARAIEGGHAVKKSELLRAGLHALASLKAPAALVKSLRALAPVKVGRPAKS